MKCLSWNCKGWGKLEFHNNFNFLCNLVKLDIFCFLELQTYFDKAPLHFDDYYFDKVFGCNPDGRAGSLFFARLPITRFLVGNGYKR